MPPELSWSTIGVIAAREGGTMTSIIPALVLSRALLGIPAVETPGGPVPHTQPTRTINLDAPGALEGVAAANPEHYRKLVDVIRVSSEIDCHAMPAMLYAKFGTAASCNFDGTLMTSFPAKPHIR